MKIFTPLLIFICLLTSIQLFGQKPPGITLSLKDVPLRTVLTEIEKQTGITFFYKTGVLTSVEKISVQVDKANLQTVLNKCLRNTPIKYTFLTDNLIVLTNKNEKKNADGTSQIIDDLFVSSTLNGMVSNVRGERLSGATATIKRTHKGTITNAKGEFTLENVRTNDTLNISFIGYDTQQVPVHGRVDFFISLKETKNELDEVMVQAYGTTTKRLLVGEITQINTRDITKQPLSNPIQALQGLVPGVLVTPINGFSGAAVKVEIRGRNGIDPNVTSDPLYVIDGVQQVTLDITTFNGASYQYGSPGYAQSGLSIGGGQSPFFSLNPEDIESITVLKDAAATAMYGARAGNGVVLITTKKGKPGVTQFNVGVDQSINKAIGHWDMLNTAQYLEMRREAFRNDGITPTIANAPDLMYWDSNRYTDWQKELLNTTKTTNIQTSLSGGSDFMTFRLSALYGIGQDLTALTDNNKNKKATVMLNLNHTSLNRKLSMSFSLSYAYTNINRVSIFSGATFAPNLPPILDQKGNLNYADWNAAGQQDTRYPFGELLMPYSANTYTLSSNTTINYKLIKGLNIGTTVGYGNMQSDNSNLTPIVSQNPIKNPTGTAIFGINGQVSFSINPEVKYDNYIGQGQLGISVGALLNSATAKGLNLVGLGYTSDKLLEAIDNAPFKLTSQTYAQNKSANLHARINYNWKNKYIVQFSGSRDGSSSFGPGRQFGNFWSAGANWIASEEKWLKNVLPTWVSLIKFSGTIGTIGVSGGDYQYLSQWSGSGRDDGSAPFLSYNGISPLLPVHAVNQDYHWQTTKMSNLSLDIGFLNDRFNLHIAHYTDRTDDQLTDLPTPIYTGFKGVKGNSRADVKNTGWEGILRADLIHTRNFSWSASFNISANRNKLVAFPGIEYTPYYSIYVIGNPLNTRYLLHYVGVDPQKGLRSFEDYNHNGREESANGSGTPGTGSDDRYVAIDDTPKFFGGLNTDLNYKKLTLSLLFNFEKKLTKLAYKDIPGGMNNVPLSALNNYWQKPGDIAINPRFSATGSDNFGNSDGSYTDGSFIRLNTVAIGYSLPDKLTKKLGMSQLKIGVSIQNVFTLTKYDGVDPDAIFGDQPQAKIFNGRISFNF